jgi:hypothetical protein
MIVKTLQNGSLDSAGFGSAITTEAPGGAKGTLQLKITTAEGLESFNVRVQGRLSESVEWIDLPSAAWTSATTAVSTTAVLADVTIYPLMRFSCQAMSGTAGTLTVVAQVGY